MSSRPVLYDITRLFLRVFNRTPNGIDRVDFALADHFLKSEAHDRYGFMTTLIGPRVFPPHAAREALEMIRRHWGEDGSPDHDEHLGHVANALCGFSPRRRVSKGRRGQFREALGWIGRYGVSLGEYPGRIGGVYFNVSQFPVWCDRCFRWLDGRPDIDGVFFLHDLLPLEMPEYFRPSEFWRHMRRLKVIARRARAAIVSSETVRSALARRLPALGRPDLPILTAPLAPDPIFSADEAIDIVAPPYFVMCGTIEPRKNHLLILHVWRDLVDQMAEKAPKLILVGERGWENEHIIDLLERSPRLRRHVVEVAGLPTPSLKRLMLGARAVLAPSFGEGYGLPVVEALAAEVPVIASDIPVFREIGGGRLTMLDLTDGPGWRDTVRAFADETSGARDQALARLKGYKSPTWSESMAAIENFLVDLSTDNRPFATLQQA